MPDYKKLYIDLFNSVTDEIGLHIQRLQTIQQASTEEFAKSALPVRLGKEEPDTKKKQPNK